MNYVLIGAGGTGSHLFPALYRYLKSREDEDPNWTIHIYDGDEVEEKNLLRQIFDEGDLFRNKADALGSKARDVDHVFTYPTFLGADDLQRAIRSGDIVLIAADNMFIRARVEEHVKLLDNAVIINGGNEDISGSVQLWIREGGKDITPPISWLHPEITNTRDEDRSAMSCAEVAMLPGGGQTVLANATAAVFMLAALWRFHQDKHKDETKPGIVPWTEVQFDHGRGTMMPWDVRPTKGWDQDRTD